MPVRKGRKGKQWHSRSAPAPVPAAPAPASSASDDPDRATTPTAEQEDANTTADVAISESAAAAGSAAALPISSSPISSPDRNGSSNHNDETSIDNQLVLTSEKRRGVFECDYCHSDISQLPRIRCAVCPDFDLCLDCFATTSVESHAALARLKESEHATLVANAAAAAASTPPGVPSPSTAAILAPFIQHDAEKHGYRVCDSTRYPVFATLPPAKKQRSRSQRTSSPVPANSAGPKKDSGATTAAAAAVRQEDGGGGAGMTPTPSAAASTVDDEDEIMQDENVASETMSTQLAAAAAKATPSANATSTTQQPQFFTYDDPRTVWTAEEDLRLLEAIKSHGLGNWIDISESISGNGSFGKTPKRCQERYLDEFCGRYGHILPPYTLIPCPEDGPAAAAGGGDEDGGAGTGDGDGTAAGDDNDETAASAAASTEGQVRASKRRAVLMRSPSVASSHQSTGGSSAMNVPSSIMMQHVKKQRYMIVPTESIEGYDQVWPYAYLPPIEPEISKASKELVDAKLPPRVPVTIGQPVLREQSQKSEQAFVRLISSLEKPEQVEKVRAEWTAERLGKPGGPTVLPIRPEDIALLPGAEVAGFMPRRGDFDVEWENDAESLIADMEFLPRESQADKDLKLKVLQIYNQRLEEREKRKQFVLSRNLYDYRKRLAHEKLNMSKDERDLMHRMRLFERFHTPAEHEQFLKDLLKAKRLRKEIAKLQLYHRLGIRTLAEAEMYELDKERRNFHTATHVHRESEAARAAAAAAAADATGGEGGAVYDDGTSASLWKQYRTTDRKVRKSINRGNSLETGTENPSARRDGKAPEAGNTTQPQPSVDAVQSGQGIKPTVETPVKTEESANPTTEDMDVDGEEKTGDTNASKHDAGANDSADKSENATATSEKKKKEHLEIYESDLAAMPGYSLLVPREVRFCCKLGLTPMEYQDVKKALIQESLSIGLLDKENASSSRRTVVMIDAERRGNVIDFLVRAGWIPTKRATIMKAIPEPTSAG